MIKSSFRHPVFRLSRGLRWIAVCAAPLFVSGCLSVPVGGDGQVATSESLPKTTGRVLGISSTTRREGTSVYVSLYADGNFKEERKVIETTTTKREKMVTVGILPGVAGCKGGDVLSNGTAAFWYNLCMLGTPTLYGLLVAPFLSPEDEVMEMNQDGFFARSALVGYHAYYRPLPLPKTVNREVGTRAETKDQVCLNDYASPEEGIRYSRTWNGEIKLLDIPEDRKKVYFRIEVSPGADLHDALAPYIGESYPVTLN